MNAAGVAAFIESLRAGGCARVRATFDGDGIDSIEVEFPPGPSPVTPFVDDKGKPVDLDAGMPALAKDPDDAPPAPALETSDYALEHANFRKRPRAA